MNIIDVLVVELGLAPQGFVQGARSVEQELEKLQRLAMAAEKATSNVQRVNLRQQFNQLASSIGVARDQLGALYDDLKKGDEEQIGFWKKTTAGVDLSVASVNRLVAGGLAAYAVFKSVKGVIDEVKNSLAGAEQRGFQAQYAGVQGKWLSAFANAAQRESGANPQESAGFVQNLRTSIESFYQPGSPGYGQMTPLFKWLAAQGIDFQKLKDDPGELTMQIADKLRGMGPAAARAVAPTLGISDQLLPTMLQGRAGINQRMDPYLKSGLTKEDLDKAHEFSQALRGVLIAWENLMTKVAADLNTTWGPTLKVIEGFIQGLGESDSKLHAVEVGTTLLATAIGITLVGAVAKLATSILSANATIMTSPLGRALLLGWAAYEGAKVIYRDPLGALLPPTPGSIQNRADEVNRERAARGEDPALAGPVGWWRRNMPTSMGGWSEERLRAREQHSEAAPSSGGGNPGTGTPAPTGGKNDVTEEKLRSFGIDPKTSAALNYISHSETKQGNVMNGVGVRMGVTPTQAFGYTAQGYWQMLNTNWRKYAGQLGFYPQYQNALAAPMDVQAKVAAAMYKKEGPTPWMSRAGGSIDAGRLQGLRDAQARATASGGGTAPAPSSGAPAPSSGAAPTASTSGAPAPSGGTAAPSGGGALAPSSGAAPAASRAPPAPSSGAAPAASRGAPVALGNTIAPSGGTAAASGGGALTAWGDSIAEGVAKAGRFNELTSQQGRDRGDTRYAAVWGRTSDQVLATLKGNAEKLRGQHMLLSTGASNDLAKGGPGWQPEVIEKQLQYLKEINAHATVLGVGTGVKGYLTRNAELDAMSKKYGFGFTGQLETTEGGRVHPRTYAPVLDHARRVSGLRAAAAGSGAQSVANNDNRETNVTIGDVNVHTAARDPEGTAAAVKRQILVTHANVGLV